MRAGSKAEAKYQSQGATFSSDPTSINTARADSRSRTINREVGPITPDSLQLQQPVSLPTPPSPAPIGDITTANNAALAPKVADLGYTLDQKGQFVYSPPQQDELTTLFDKYMSNQEAPPDLTSAYAKLEKQNKLDAKRASVNSLTGQLNAITSKAQADKLSLEGQGRGVTDVIIGGQQAQIDREAAIRALPVQAQLAAAQGDLEMAQQHVDKLFSLYAQDAQAQYQYRSKLVDSVYSFASEQQKRKLDAIQRKEDQAFQLQLKDLDFRRQKELLAYKAGLDASNTPAATNQNLTVANDISNIRNNAAFNKTFGLANIANRNIPNTPENALKSDVNTLISQLALAARGQLKGQGAVSDFEGRLLKQAQTSLNFNMGPEQARYELAQVEGAIRTSSGLPAMVKITDPETGEAGVVQSNQQGITQAIADGYRVEYFVENTGGASGGDIFSQAKTTLLKNLLGPVGILFP